MSIGSPIAFEPDELIEAEICLSPDRLASLAEETGSTYAAVILHGEIMQIGAALAAVTGIIEISLRNTIAGLLDDAFRTSEWLLTPPEPFKWHELETKAIQRAIRSAKKAHYAKMNHVEKRALDNLAFPGGVPISIRHEKRVRQRQDMIEVTRGRIIAELSLNFWKRLFASEYEDLLWKRALKKVFPDKAISRAEVAGNLEVIYQTRNRVAHHEFVRGERLQDVLRAMDFLAATFRARRTSDRMILAKLLVQHRANLYQAIERFGSAAALP